MKKIMDKLHFEVHLVEHCNLNCKGCAHFAPLAKEEYLDIVKYRHDILRLAELTNNDMAYIKLLGGEPLLHPKIEEIFDLTRSVFKNTPIILITNGINLPDMREKFWDSCRKNRIIVEITKYPIDID